MIVIPRRKFISNANIYIELPFSVIIFLHKKYRNYYEKYIFNY